MKIHLLIFMLLLTVSLFSQKSQGIQFIENKPFEEVLQLAKEQNKLIFMDCYTTWCGPCIQLAKNIFPKKEAGDFFNKNFIPVKYDMEKGEGKEIMKKYDIKVFPTLLFINSQGEIVYKQLGAPAKVTDLIETGKKALSPDNNYQAMMEKINNSSLTSELPAETIANYLRTELPDRSAYWLDRYIEVLEKDSLYTKSTLYMIAQYSDSYFDKQFQFLLSNEEKYKEKLGDSLVNKIIMNKILDAILKVDYIKNSDHPMVKAASLKAEQVSAQRSFQQHQDSLSLWNEFIQATKAYLESEFSDISDMKHATYMIIHHFDQFKNQKTTEMAAKWAKQVVDREENMTNLDTYAFFLFEMGEIEKACDVQKKALDLSKESGKVDYIKALESRLKKYKEALQKENQI